jgi:hypothetical protein
VGRLMRIAQGTLSTVMGVVLASVCGTLLLVFLPGAALAVSAPAIESESATNVTMTDATLDAAIDPNGLYTAYEFQIDTSASYDYTKFACPLPLPGYAQCMAIIDGPPLPAGLVEPEPAYISAASGSQLVSLDLAGIGATLQPDTTYHYRVIASNGGQMAQGPDQTFTTLSASLPPVIESGQPESGQPPVPTPPSGSASEPARSLGSPPKSGVKTEIKGKQHGTKLAKRHGKAKPHKRHKRQEPRAA